MAHFLTVKVTVMDGVEGPRHATMWRDCGGLLVTYCGTTGCRAAAKKWRGRGGICNLLWFNELERKTKAPRQLGGGLG